MARLVKFGTTVLPPTFAPLEDSLSRDIQPAKLPRTDGSRVIRGYAREKIIPVEGSLIKGPISNLWGYNDLRSAVDALRALCADGLQPLYFWDDRYYPDAQAQDVLVRYEMKRYESIAHIEIPFVVPTPFQEYHSETHDAWLTPSTTRTITTLGDAYTPPLFKFTSGSATINWRLTNNTTGKFFTLAGIVVAGQVIEVDVRAKTVVIGATDRMDLFDEQFFDLEAGANQLQVTLTVGTISRLDTYYRNRWNG